MNKQEFIEKLKSSLSGLPEDDISERLDFYAEMIDDRIEDGISEEDAVLSAGNIDDIVKQIMSDIPLKRIVKEKVRKRRKLSTLAIVLICVGSPVWFPILIALFAVAISLYITLFAVLISLWAVEASIAATTLGSFASGIIFAVTENPIAGIVMISAGLVLSGLSIFLFFGCRAATKAILKLPQKVILAIKKIFVKKETVQ